MELSKFDNTLLYSNKNMEKLARNLVNESCNAVLMEMFSDKCILADHITSNIYEADYSFDGKTFIFENFNKLSFYQSRSELKEAINEYFDDADVDLAEAYEANLAKSNFEAFESSLTEALASKKMDSVIDYSELNGINEEVETARNTSTFKLFEERLSKFPTQSAKMFNWKNPVKVSLLDEDYQTVVNKSAKTKAKELKNNEQFREDLMEVSKIALEGDVEVMEDFVRDYSCLTALNKAGLKEVVGMSVIGNKELMENRNKIVSMIENVIDLCEDLAEKKAILSEETEIEKDKDAPEADEEDTKEIVKALETAKSKVKDEKLIKKIEDIISSIEDSVEAGETDVSAMKEAVELLNF